MKKIYVEIMIKLLKYFWLKKLIFLKCCFYSYLQLQILFVSSSLHKTCAYTVNTGKVFMIKKNNLKLQCRQLFDGSVIFMKLYKKSIMFVIYLLYVIRLS